MKSDNDARGIWSWDIVKYVVGFSVVFFIFLMFFYGWNEEGVRQNIRWTARISFVLFCLAFSASAIHWHVKNSLSWWLRMNRKFFGVSFAIIHLIHLGAIILLQSYFHPVFDNAATISIIGGSGAYLFIVLMLVTSFDRFAKFLNNNQWRMLHTVGGYWIWIVFMSTYLKRVDEPIHWVFVLVLILVLGLRVSYLIKNRLSK